MAIRDFLADLGKDEIEGGDLREIYYEGVRVLEQELRSYRLNASFTEGYQWIHWLPHINDINTIDAENDRLQAVVNRIRGNMRVTMAHLTQRYLTFEVPPTAADDASILGARKAEALLKDLHFQQSWEQLREEVLLMIVKGGTGALCVEWDEDKDEAKVTPLAISEFFMEPGVRRYQDARWWMRVQALPPSLVKDMYPDKFDDDDFPPADIRQGTSASQAKLVGLHKYDGTSEVALTRVLTMYERPHRGCEEGRVVVEVDGEIMEEIDWPFPDDDLNIVVGRETVLEDKWTGSTYLDDVRRIQVMVNVLWTQLAEHVRNVGTGRILIPQSGWEQALDAFTDEPGQLVSWPDGSEKPEFMRPPNPGAWITDLLDRANLYIDDLMGVHDVSRGVAPANVESGYGVAILAEKDASPVGRLIKETARMWEEVARKVLRLYEQRGKKRSASVDLGLGPENMEFNPKKDLKGQTNARIPLDKIVPRDRAELLARADRFVQMGLITDIGTYAAVASMEDADDLVSAMNPDMAKARRENEMMSVDNLSYVDTFADFDSHDIHISVHDAFRKTQRYENLSPEARQTVDDHLQAHKTFQAEAMAKEDSFNAMRQQMNNPQDPNQMLPEEMPPPEAMPPAEQPIELTPDAANPDKIADMMLQGLI